MVKKQRLGKVMDLDANDQSQHERIQSVCHALSTPERLKILLNLYQKPKNLSELSAELDLPISSVSRHIDALVGAGLATINYQPGVKGQTKICYQAVSTVNITLSPQKSAREKGKDYCFELPVGLYGDCSVSAPCGMAGKNDSSSVFDTVDAFYSPCRTDAECVWFNTGFLTYNFPAQYARKNAISELSFSFEISFENNYYNDRDLTVLINDTEVATVTATGNFNQRRGRFTPPFWNTTAQQFGELKTVSVTNEGVLVDGNLVTNSVTISHLNLKKSQAIKLTLQAKRGAGVHIFGKNFGDYPQGIIMKIR